MIGTFLYVWLGVVPVVVSRSVA